MTMMVVVVVLCIKGSLNYTRSAVRSNRENVIVTKDPQLVQPFVHEFKNVWQICSTCPT